MPYAGTFLTLLGLLLIAGSASGQQLPLSATPRGVIFAFLTETASPIDSIDRSAFRERLTGDFARSDPRSFRGLLPGNSRVRIDSIPDLADSDEGLKRVAAFVTVDQGGEKENWYFYCAGDSIWRLDALRRFPSASQRTQIRASLREIDTTIPHYRLLRADLLRMLLPDDTLRALFRDYRADAEKLMEPLRKAKQWRAFSLREVDFSKLEEYRELDDDIEPGNLIFYTVDRPAIERLKSGIGLRRIERDSRYPGLVFFVTGTIDKSSYGYIHAPAPADIPQLSSEEFIALKPIGNGWWLYKRLK